MVEDRVVRLLDLKLQLSTKLKGFEKIKYIDKGVARGWAQGTRAPTIKCWLTLIRNNNKPV